VWGWGSAPPFASGIIDTVLTKRVSKKKIAKSRIVESKIVAKNNPAAKNKLQLLHSEKLTALPWLIHAFSTRNGGVSRAYGGNALNLGFTKNDLRATVERNRELFITEIGATNGTRKWPLVSLRQIHSDLIFRVDGENQLTPTEPLAADGIVTDTPGLLLAIQTADCLPVILVDQKRRAVGVFHAGWRGTVKRIVEKGVGEMEKHFGSDARNLIAAIGPGIQKCCYDVGEEVRTKFEMQFAYADSLFHEVKDSDPVRDKYPLLFLTARAPGHSDLPIKLFLDLVEANRRQLLDAGVLAKNIEVVGSCTACNTDLLFSFRKEKGVTGRMMAVAGIRPE
jgi:polyphenol oxidase